MAPKMSRYACGDCSEDCKSQGLLCEVSNFTCKITMEKKPINTQPINYSYCVFQSKKKWDLDCIILASLLTEKNIFLTL